MVVSIPKPKKRAKKAFKPLRRSYIKRSTKPLRKRGKSPYKIAKRKAWDAFSRFIRLRDALKTTGTTTILLCYTCDKEYPAFGLGCAQAGHFIEGRGNLVLFDERQVHGQCYNCNVNLKGRWSVYLRKMRLEHGVDLVETMIESKLDELKLSIDELGDIQRIYEAKYLLLLKTI